MAGTTLTMTVGVSPGGLNLDPSGGLYTFPEGGFSHGAQTWRRTTAESIYVEGRTAVATVRDTAIGLITVRVFGTLAQQKTNMAAIITAFSQVDYTTTITIDGTPHIWSNCEPADYSIASGDGTLSGPHLMAGQQNIVLQVPHSPGFT